MNVKTIMQVPLLDLNTQYETIKEDVKHSILNVFDSKQFINGPTVAQLESESANYCGVEYAIGCSSGSDALLMALMSLDIGPGDEVITSPFTFFATAGSIARVGATPVFVDIYSDTFNIDVSQIESKITSKTKAIMPVHIFGQMVDMQLLMTIAKKHNLFVIEDAAQAIGSKCRIDGEMKKAGSIGDFGCFSFFPSKNLGACGDGGLLTTQSKEFFEKAKMLRNHGESSRYHHNFVGGNFRLDSIQAAVLSVKLPHLDSQHDGRRRNGAFYNKHLADVVETPVIADFAETIYNQYTIKVENRDMFKDSLDKQKVGNAIYYPVPLHLQKCFDYLGYQKGDFSVCETVSKQVISLPVFSELKQNQLEYVVSCVKQAI